MYKIGKIKQNRKSALNKGNRDALIRIYNLCPDVSNMAIAVMFLNAEIPYRNMVSLHNLAFNYFNSQNFEFAELFAQSCLEYSAKLIQSDGLKEHPEIVQYLGDAAGFRLGCCCRTGKNKKGIKIFNEVNKTFSQYMSNKYFGGFKLYGVQLFLDNNNLEKAFELMN